MICLKPQRAPGGDKNRGGVLWPVPVLRLLVLAASRPALFYKNSVLVSPCCHEVQPVMQGLSPMHAQH